MTSDANVSTYSQRAPTVRIKIGSIIMLILVISFNSEIKAIPPVNYIILLATSIILLWIYACH